MYLAGTRLNHSAKASLSVSSGSIHICIHNTYNKVQLSMLAQLEESRKSPKVASLWGTLGYYFLLKNILN